MAKILKYPDETKRIPKGAVIICPTCKRDNYRALATIDLSMVPSIELLESVKTGEVPDPTDKFACQFCKKTLFRDGMVGLLLLKMG